MRLIPGVRAAVRARAARCFDTAGWAAALAERVTQTGSGPQQRLRVNDGNLRKRNHRPTRRPGLKNVEVVLAVEETEMFRLTQCSIAALTARSDGVLHRAGTRAGWAGGLPALSAAARGSRFGGVARCTTGTFARCVQPDAAPLGMTKAKLASATGRPLICTTSKCSPPW